MGSHKEEKACEDQIKRNQKKLRNFKGMLWVCLTQTEFQVAKPVLVISARGESKAGEGKDQKVEIPTEALSSSKPSEVGEQGRKTKSNQYKVLCILAANSQD